MTPHCAQHIGVGWLVGHCVTSGQQTRQQTELTSLLGRGAPGSVHLFERTLSASGGWLVREEHHGG